MLYSVILKLLAVLEIVPLYTSIFAYAVSNFKNTNNWLKSFWQMEPSLKFYWNIIEYMSIFIYNQEKLSLRYIFDKSI